MSEYRFHLQKYKYGSKISCPSCGKPRCFVKYVDAEGEIAFPGNVGKCDHENSCGYHYTPKEYFKHHSVRLQSLSSRHCSCKHGTALDSAVYFKDNPDVLTRDQSVGESFQAALCKFIEKKPVLIVPSYIPLSYVDRSLSHYEINPLYRYLCNVFGEEETIRLFQLYRIGASVKWGGSAVFWQIDINGLVRTGKIMCYNPENGHRIKEPQAFVSWAHSELRMPDFHLKQCLFGEHLLKGSSVSPVMLVESEKQQS